MAFRCCKSKNTVSHEAAFTQEVKTQRNPKLKSRQEDSDLAVPQEINSCLGLFGFTTLFLPPSAQARSKEVTVPKDVRNQKASRSSLIRQFIQLQYTTTYPFSGRKKHSNSPARSYGAPKKLDVTGPQEVSSSSGPSRFTTLLLRSSAAARSIVTVPQRSYGAPKKLDVTEPQEVGSYSGPSSSVFCLLLHHFRPTLKRRNSPAATLRPC